MKERELGVELDLYAGLEARELLVTARNPVTGAMARETLFTDEELKGGMQKLAVQFYERLAAIAAKVKEPTL